MQRLQVCERAHPTRDAKHLSRCWWRVISQTAPPVVWCSLVCKALKRAIAVIDKND